MPKYDVLTIGGAVEDITFFTSDGVVLKNPKNDPTCLKFLAFEYGAKLKIDEADFYFGGGAQNAAVCFSRLGFKTAALLSVGNDGYGRNIIKNLNDNKVQTCYIQAQKKSGTGFSFILTDRESSEHVVFSYRGANAFLTVDDKILKEISARLVYLTSLSGKWQSVLKNIFRNKNNKVKVAWNPGKLQLEAGYEILKKYLKMTDVLILNRDEAIELDLNVKKTASVKNISELVASLYKVMEHGNILVITDGKNGAYAYDGNNLHFAPIKDVKRVNTTGVGDAFGSSFVAGLELYKGDIKKALKLGILNTSSVVGKKGAESGLLYRKDIEFFNK